MEYRPRPKRRIILPATPPPPPRPWDERDRYDPICLVSSDPAMIEQVRSLVYRLPCRQLWHTGSRRTAAAWLKVHPRCPLLIEDQGQDVATSNPSAPAPATTLHLAPPQTATPIWTAVRKIFPWPPGTNFYNSDSTRHIGLARRLLLLEQTKWRNLERGPD